MEKAQLYCITHKQTGKKYIGMTWGKNMSYRRRFKKHMSGKGGVYIRKLLDKGFTENDFNIELLEVGDVEYIREREACLSQVYPKGLNGNVGKAIIQTEEIKRKAQDKRNGKMDLIKRNISKSVRRAYERNDGELRKKISKSLKEAYRRNDGELRKRLSEKLKGKYAGEKCYWYGKNHTDDTKKKISETHKDVPLSYKHRNKISDGMKNYLGSISDEDMKKRIYKSLRTCDDKKRGEAISRGKKGKKTDQQEIMKKRYKSMSDEEFNKWCEGRLSWVIKRAYNLRNG